MTLPCLLSLYLPASPVQKPAVYILLVCFDDMNPVWSACKCCKSWNADIPPGSHHAFHPHILVLILWDYQHCCRETSLLVPFESESRSPTNKLASPGQQWFLWIQYSHHAEYNICKLSNSYKNIPHADYWCRISNRLAVLILSFNMTLHPEHIYCLDISTAVIGLLMISKDDPWGYLTEYFDGLSKLRGYIHDLEYKCVLGFHANHAPVPSIALYWAPLSSEHTRRDSSDGTSSRRILSKQPRMYLTYGCLSRAVRDWQHL